MTSAEARILELYRLFNGRDFAGFYALLADDVDWANDAEDTRLHGKAAVRAYVQEETAPLRANFAPLYIWSEGDEVSVITRQVITSAADQSIWSDTLVNHVYRLRDGLVTRQDTQRDLILAEGTPGAKLHDAVNRRDIDGVMAVFHPDAHIPDNLEGGELSTPGEIRAYYQRQFDTIQVNAGIVASRRLSEDRFEELVCVVVKGAEGGFWWEGPITMTYSVRDGLITELRITEQAQLSET